MMWTRHATSIWELDLPTFVTRQVNNLFKRCYYRSTSLDSSSQTPPSAPYNGGLGGM